MLNLNMKQKLSKAQQSVFRELQPSPIISFAARTGEHGTYLLENGSLASSNTEDLVYNLSILFPWVVLHTDTT